jgi:hypothetical protein
MSRCPSCDYPLPHDRERIGARCPSCRDPLYEPPGRAARLVPDGEGACAFHAGRESVGTCGRCGNYFCVVCQTRWRDRTLCAACVERALESREAAPEQERAHLRQAILGSMLGGGAWISWILAILVVAVAVVFKLPLLVFLGLLGILAAILLAAIGLGQAVAALRTRGSHLILATIGLVVSGLFFGAFIGQFVFQLWFL